MGPSLLTGGAVAVRLPFRRPVWGRSRARRRPDFHVEGRGSRAASTVSTAEEDPGAMAIDTAKVHDPPGPATGRRVLIDRLWPRGVSKERAAVEKWLKEIAPSDGLRRWYGHDPDKWDEFRRRYEKELAGRPAEVEELLAMAREGDLVLVYGSKERRFNNAAALKAYLEARL